MKIGVKLIAGFFVVAFLVVFVGVFGITSINNIQENNQITAGITELIDLLDGSLIQVLQIIETENLEDYHSIKSKIEDTRKEFDILHKRIHSFAHHLEEFEQFDENVNDFTKISNGIIAIQKENIIQQREFDEKYNLEKQLRYVIRTPLFALENHELTKAIGSLQYLSKEALFQYKNKEKTDEWLDNIKNVKNNPLVKQLPDVVDNLNKYENVARDLGEIVIEKTKAEDDIHFKIAELRGIIDKFEEQKERIVNTIHSKSQSVAKNTYLTLLIVTIITFIVAIVGGLYIAHSISKPIKELTKASEEIKKGNLDYEVKIKSKDEIGQLAETFSEMRHGLSQDIKDRNDLLNSLLDVFKGKLGKVAGILVRKNVDDLVKKNPRIEKILPKSLRKSSKKEGEISENKSKPV